MNIQIFGTKKCRATQKTVRWFKERRINHHFVDLNQKGLSPGELNNITRVFDADDLIDRDGTQFKKRNLQYMKFDPFAEILDDPLLLKTPIVRNKGKVTVGYDPDAWEEWRE